MGFFKVIKPGAYTSIQDSGRKGFNFYAVPNSGVMDIISVQLANRIVGNTIDEAVIECTSVAPAIEFQSDAHICVTGANAQWQLNNQDIKLDKKIKIKKDDVLSGKNMTNGLRSYIAIAGKIKTQLHFGSVSLYLNAKLGGHNGHVFRKNDVVEWEEYSAEYLQPIAQTDIESMDSHLLNSEIEIYKGPEYDRLEKEDIREMETVEFMLSKETSRMGAKLDCEKSFICKPKHLINSVPVFPGVIQATPSGKLIVVLQDGQTTGGYPRIAYIDRYQLNYFNQIPLNKPFLFNWRS